jgi:membrane-bound metal-dependent hydrolase YbcI (DUF457 family)
MVAVGAATAPDLDLLLKLFDGRNHHQGPTHSLVAVLAAVLVAAVVASVSRAGRPRRWALLVGLAWASHLLLDFLARDTSPPIGIPVLWPARLYFHFPAPIFLDIGRTLDWATVRHDAVAMAWEVAILLPILALTYRWRSRRAT